MSLKLCSVLSVIIYLAVSEHCVNSKYEFENHLGTRTPYRIVSNTSWSKIQYEGCTPKKIWMIVRHGTRNPSVSNIERIQNRLPQIKELILNTKHLPIEAITNRDLDRFRQWKTKLNVDDEQKLTHEGEDEMLLLAERMQKRFPEILDGIYSNSSYQFKYTYSQRTQKSAYYFASGLFGRKTAKDVWFPEPSKMDPILRFYKLCNKWKHEIKSKVKSSGQHKIFEKSPEILNVVREVNERLNLREQLSTDDILIMYVACGFETAWNKQTKSPWCSPFTIDNLKVLEYLEDLKYYWQDGYGHELSYRQACPAFKNMINFFEEESSLPKATIYFTHSGTLLKMLAHLGLYKENVHLSAENYDKMSDRKWKTSLIDTFGTNLAFVLFRCEKDDKILTLHQEKVMELPCCPGQDLCDLKTVQEFYSNSISNCDFDYMCENPNSTN